MLKPKRDQFNVKSEIEHAKLRHGRKIRRRQDAWKAGEVAAGYGARRNIWPASIRLWPDSCRTCGESLDFDSGSRTKEKTAAGFPFHRERPLSGTAAPGDLCLPP